jgi:prepilin-type processing-associated H-X9-DG protein
MGDNQGVFPGQGTGGSAVADPSTNGPNSWFNALPPYVSEQTMNRLWIDRKVPRPRSKSIFVCPAAPDNQKPADTPPRLYYANYAMNQWIEGASTRGCSGDDTPTPSTLPQFLRISQIPKAANFAVMAENPTGTGANGNPGYQYAHTHVAYMAYPTVGDAFRHNSRANVMFGDGHAAGFAKSKIYTSSMNDYWNYGGVQWNPDNPNIDGPCP